MKKVYLMMTAFLMTFTQWWGVSAQTLLDEGFEGVTVTKETDEFPEGWTTKNGYEGESLRFKWSCAYSSSGSTMSGHHYAAVDAPSYVGTNTDGIGPREEMLITPELNLDNTYQLSFDWYSAAAAVFDDKSYTFQVRVLDVDAVDATWQTIWDYTNEEQVRNSGVPGSVYNAYKGWLWDAWTIYNSKLDLTPFMGKKIKIAFVYVLKKKVGNVLYLDNISVKQYTPFTSPLPQVNNNTYNYGEVYIGEKFYSEAFKLKNVGLAGLRITGFDAPKGVTLVADTAHINLGVNEEALFQIGYQASLTLPSEVKAVVKTNGGDVELSLKAEKQLVPDGYTLELFEGRQFAPAGWTNDGWNSTFYALEGDNSAYASGSLEDNYLTSPRLDLSKADGPHDVRFTYYIQYVGDDGNVPYNDLVLEATDDGGVKWKALYTSDYTKTDTLIHAVVDLSAFNSDNVYVRWKNTAIEYNSQTGADPYGTIFLDRILLPTIYGADATPGVATLVAPKDSLMNVYTKNVLLQWQEAQFAEGYKLYLGTSSTNFDVINGLDLGDTLQHTLAPLNYSTTYYWKIVPYNAKGDAADVPVWMFTTQADYTVKTFPWKEDFESAVPPLGWNIESDGTTRWMQNNYMPFDGKSSASASIRGKIGYASLNTPDIVVPAGSDYTMSFWWGNGMGASLTKDENSVRLNKYNKEKDGIDAGYFEVFVDGEWKQLTMISDPNDEQYWVYESFSLAPYAGKTISFRWRYEAENYSKSKGLSIDNVAINGAAVEMKINTERWDAYKVNAHEVATSPTIALTNLGSVDAKVKKVAFASASFSSSLEVGKEVKAAETVLFTVSFDARGVADADSLLVDDEMVITMTDGTEVTMPVTAVALADDIFYYGFENDETGKAPAGLTVIDGDGISTAPITFWSTPNIGSAMAFFVLNDAECYNSLKEPHGHQSLMTRCNINGAANDWLVSPMLTITDKSTIQFDARAWESVNSIMPAEAPNFKVLVSETSATDRKSFVEIGGENPGLFDNVAWTRYSYDLSSYAGKNIFVAIQAIYSNSLGGFVDNVEYDHVTIDPAAINSILADQLNEAYVEIYRTDGVKVAEGKGALRNVGKGIYVVKTGNRSLKVMK